MKRFILVLMVLSGWMFTTAATQEAALFGPVKYDVKERYGADNVYTEKFKAGEGLFLVRIDMGSGARAYERPEFLELTLNGEKILRDDKYDFPVLAGILRLKKENSLELHLKDSKPSGFKRPPLPPRYATITVLPYVGKMPEGVFGVRSIEHLNEIASLLNKVSNPVSAPLAVASLNLRNDAAVRVESVRKLSSVKDMNLLPFLTALFENVSYDPDIRGEAALALGMLGDPRSVPLLVNGILDPEEKPRLGAARALSFFKEEDTREAFIKTVERLDAMRREAVMKAVSNSGWKPVAALMSLAESTDAHISRNAISMLGLTRDPRATDLLLKLLADPGPRDLKAIITGLRDAGDKRAVEPLLAMAKDPKRRAGYEVELGEALAELRDQRAADVIRELSGKAPTRFAQIQLQHAYKRLTGKDLR